MNPEETYRKAISSGKRLLELEDIILTCLRYSYRYALNVVEGRWIEAEDIIMNSSYYSSRYASHVIKGKLPEKMHNMMILHAIKDPEDKYVKDYFELIK